MTKFNKTMTDDEFLQELHLMDPTKVIEAFNEVNIGSYEINEAGELIGELSYSEDIRYLLELQSALPDKILCDYDYILTGIYYNETNASDDIFELIEDTFKGGWLYFKDELIEYFSKKELN